ncbi:MAG: hypothetical protein KAG66_24420 [Methylococcales bacterium]|nr:hypothetical protein [Methylococcales bacterium]
MEREPKKYDYITMKELRMIERLCQFLEASSNTFYPDDFNIYDADCELLGKICHEADINEFVFVPASLEQEGC